MWRIKERDSKTGGKVTEEDAKEQAKKQTFLYRPFCPLIKDDCNHNCISFKPAKVYKDDVYNEWFVNDAHCNNKMLCGD